MGTRKGPGLTRRELIRAVTGTTALAAAGASRTGSAMQREGWDVIVVGAGVFGAWTAWHLRRLGQRVLLLDASGPANARASSGGESRLTRTIYGADDVYTRMAWDSLDDWRWLSSRSGLPILHPIGVLMFFGRREPFVDQTIEAHRRLGLRLDVLDRAELQRRYPQVSWDGVEVGLFEPELGALMARRAVQTLVQEFVAAGGEYRLAAVLPPADGAALEGLGTSAGETPARRALRLRVRPLAAEAAAVAARRPHLPHPPGGLLRRAGERRRALLRRGTCRAGRTSTTGDIYYGFPDLEGRGFKIAHDKHGARFDPDSGDRLPSAAGMQDVRAYMARRFPALAGRPFVESRVCQYENSSNGDLLIDRHPQWPNAFLVGAGSGHGFKHGPAVGRYAAELVTGRLARPEPRFSLATKGEAQRREVH